MLPNTPNLRHPDDFEDVGAWLWLWLPLAYVVLQYTARSIGDEFYTTYFHGELGITEMSTLVALLAAVASGIATLVLLYRLNAGWLIAWVGLITLGCVYFAGEEASWGQHIFGWGTPEAWAKINDQGETNVHNSGGPAAFFLDQGPRFFLGLAAFIGGVIMPLWRRFKKRPLDPAKLAYWLWPTLACLPAALLAIVLKRFEDVAELLLGRVPEIMDISGENKETFLALFLLIYLYSLRLRLLQLRRALN